MNSYYNIFLNITQSVERLVQDEHNSLEIKQSATTLSESVKPCIEELKQSATKLKQLMLVCSNELNHAENVWLCKPTITEAVKDQIWEQLGEISGRSIRLRQLGSQSKDEAVSQAKKSLNIGIECLRNKWFVDAKGQPKKGVGWDDKKGFINEIKPIIDFLHERLDQILKEHLNLVYEELKNIQLEPILHYISLLDRQKQDELNKQMKSLASEVKTKFNNPIEYLPNYIPSLKMTISPDLKALIDNGWGDIYWEDVVTFKNKVSIKIDKFITTIFEDRVKLGIEIIANAIAFYNDFLEQQERYQQETPEQREAEKAWIEQQHQALAQVVNSIETILNAS
jgi:hypothetical protein